MGARLYIAQGGRSQDHNDFVGFANIALLNWTNLECTVDHLPVICDEQPVELYGKTIWKRCLFGYICFDKNLYADEFDRCTKLGDDFSPVLCSSNYEYPANFNCYFYDKFACHRGKHYIYSCICNRNRRNVNMTTCANGTVCKEGLTAATTTTTTTATTSQRAISVPVTTQISESKLSTRISTKPQKQAQCGLGPFSSLKIICILLASLLVKHVSPE